MARTKGSVMEELRRKQKEAELYLPIPRIGDLGDGATPPAPKLTPAEFLKKMGISMEEETQKLGETLEMKPERNWWDEANSEEEEEEEEEEDPDTPYWEVRYTRWLLVAPNEHVRFEEIILFK